jgi:hypothetical protein
MAKQGNEREARNALLLRVRASQWPALPWVIFPVADREKPGVASADLWLRGEHRRGRDPASEYAWGAFAKLLGRQGALAGHAPYRSAARKHTGIA